MICALVNIRFKYIPAMFQNISVLVVLIYSWMISSNMKNAVLLQDVFYGE